MNRDYTTSIKPTTIDSRNLSCVAISDHIHTVQLLSKIHCFPRVFFGKTQMCELPAGLFTLTVGRKY